jgi:hypothetical protein
MVNFFCVEMPQAALKYSRNARILREYVSLEFLTQDMLSSPNILANLGKTLKDKEAHIWTSETYKILPNGDRRSKAELLLATDFEGVHIYNVSKS